MIKVIFYFIEICKIKACKSIDVQKIKNKFLVLSEFKINSRNLWAFQK
jgi:hypothetical protein